MIRYYKADDQKQIIKLFKANVPKYFAAAEEQDLIDYLESEIEDYFVIEHQEKIVGAGGINYKDKSAIISWDFIHPKMHRKGLGSMLVNHRIKMIKESNRFEKIIVRTSQHTDRFYNKLGFKKIETIQDYWAKGFDLVKMEIDLT